MATTRYNLMKESTTVKDEDGNYYYDPLSLNLDSFRLTQPALKYNLTESNIRRIDLLMYSVYNVPYYDDILLLLNNIGILDEAEPGDIFYIPEKVDLDTFVLNNKPVT